MTISELHIQLDLQPENKIDVLKDTAIKCNEGYFFVDSSNGYCYLFSKNGNEDDIQKIKYISDWKFWGCESLISIVIPDSIKSIGNQTFGGCKNLKSIIIPNSVESIGYGAFWCCESLISIVIPDSVESIRDHAFWSCESLKSVSFKGKTIDQVKAMENYPFGIKDESIIKCI